MTVSLTVTNQDGLSNTTQTTIDIAANTRTYFYVDPTGANGSGSQLSPFNNWSDAKTALAANGAGNVGILLKRGTTTTVSDAIAIDRSSVNTNLHIGAYGAGANPVLNDATTSGGLTIYFSHDPDGSW